MGRGRNAGAPGMTLPQNEIKNMMRSQNKGQAPMDVDLPPEAMEQHSQRLSEMNDQVKRLMRTQADLRTHTASLRRSVLDLEKAKFERRQVNALDGILHRRENGLFGLISLRASVILLVIVFVLNWRSIDFVARTVLPENFFSQPEYDDRETFETKFRRTFGRKPPKAFQNQNKGTDHAPPMPDGDAPPEWFTEEKFEEYRTRFGGPGNQMYDFQPNEGDESVGAGPMPEGFEEAKAPEPEPQEPERQPWEDEPSEEEIRAKKQQQKKAKSGARGSQQQQQNQQQQQQQQRGGSQPKRPQRPGNAQEKKEAPTKPRRPTFGTDRQAF